MKLRMIIAGGRDYHMAQDDYARLDLISDMVDEVVSGGARGVDMGGEFWAMKHRIPIKRFPADWDGPLGKGAGLARNGDMARYATHLAVFPGGRGTANMVEQAKAYGLTIWDYRPTLTGRSGLVNVNACDPRDWDVYIGRGSKWGNPFVEGTHGSRKTVIHMYRQWILRQPELMTSLHELKGKRLGCHCSPKPCHGDVLIEMFKGI